MVENVVEDGVEPKPGKNKASGEGSGVGKPTNEVKFKVKIPFQVEAHILHNQAKPVPTGNFEEKPKPVPTGVRVIQVNIGSFFYNKRKMERSRRITWLGSSTSG